MALSPFDDAAHAPEPEALAATLGPSAPLWERVARGVAERHAPIDEAWHFGGRNYGWSMRLRRKDRTVLYLIPQAGHFLVGVVFGEKALRAARASDVPASVIALFDAARPYAEGRGIRLPVRSAADAEVVLALAAIKLAS